MFQLGLYCDLPTLPSFALLTSETNQLVSQPSWLRHYQQQWNTPLLTIGDIAAIRRAFAKPLRLDKLTPSIFGWYASLSDTNYNKCCLAIPNSTTPGLVAQLRTSARFVRLITYPVLRRPQLVEYLEKCWRGIVTSTQPPKFYKFKYEPCGYCVRRDGNKNCTNHGKVTIRLARDWRRCMGTETGVISLAGWEGKTTYCIHEDHCITFC